MSQSVLDRIGAQVKKRLEEEKSRRSLEELKEASGSARRPFNFLSLFQNASGYKVIAEVKFASPSEGRITEASDPVQVARDYLKNGAQALSILTEQDSFKGNPEYLVRVRKEFPVAHLLMKDFVVDEYQLYRARVDGADAILLIVALLGDSQSKEFMFQALELGLSPLVEVHDEEEMKIACDMGARLIGVNNRNLKTLEISLNTSEKLATLAPPGATLIAESGLKKGQDLKRLREMGYKGFLIGSHFMKTGQPGSALQQLLTEAEAP